MFGDSVLKLACLLSLGRPKGHVGRCFVCMVFLFFGGVDLAD